jgi:hypothetical protein
VVKRIKDIRYYEGTQVPSPGVAHTVADGTLFRLPPTSATLGQRIAVKLRELGLTLGAFDHLYLVFTPALAPDGIVDTGWGGEPWFRYVACGLPSGFNRLTDAKRLAVLTQRTFAALRVIAPRGEDAIGRAEDLLREHGDDLQIHLLTHKTRRFEIELSYTVAPFGVRPSQGWITVNDLVADRSGRAPFVDLTFFDDIFFIASRVSMRGREITISPRRSERATVTTRTYETPIRLDVDAILAG